MSEKVVVDIFDLQTLFSIADSEFGYAGAAINARKIFANIKEKYLPNPPKEIQNA